MKNNFVGFRHSPILVCSLCIPAHFEPSGCSSTHKEVKEHLFVPFPVIPSRLSFVSCPAILSRYLFATIFLRFPIGPISHPLYITLHLNQKIIASIQLPHLLSNTLSNQISSLYEVHASVLRLLVSQRKPCEDLPCFQNPYFPFLPVFL